MEQTNKVPLTDILGVVFLVGGACIGGGMLGLPIGTAHSGFMPSIVMMLVAWFFMTASSLLILEVNLWLEEGAHFISMTQTYLGRWGKGAAWLLYLFIGYASLVAYTSGGGTYISTLVSELTGLQIEKWMGCFIFTAVFGGIIYMGCFVVERVNSILFIAMIASYFALIVVGIPELKPTLLLRQNWGRSFSSIPLLLTAFSFQSIVPSLRPVLKSNAKLLRLSIIAGTMIPLLVYFVWQALVHGIIPYEGGFGLSHAFEKGTIATESLRNVVDNVYLATIADFFAFFALVTSFLGIALGLFDFLADGLKITKKGMGSVVLGFLVAAPTIFFTLSYPRAFLVAMETSGGFGDALLIGIMPVMMVWIGRYHMAIKAKYRVSGGKLFLVLVFLFYAFVFFMEFREQFMDQKIFSAD